MAEVAKQQNGGKEVGRNCYLNKNCWLVKNLNNAPYERCQYCEFKFRNCLFLQYQIISVVLISISLGLFFLIDQKLSFLPVAIVFTLVIIYGFFFNKTTENIVKANFSLKKTKDALKELTDKLEERVEEQTKDIKEKSKYLQELLNMKADFLRVVNHQLNTPISIVKASFSMLDEKIWDINKTLETIKEGFQRISQTVQDFWDAYELEGEKMKMNINKTDLISIIDKLITEKNKLPLAFERKLVIFANVPDYKIPEVWCDDKKITHVISNILDNAVYYTKKGVIVVNYEIVDKKYLKVSISDTGVGISKDDKKILFQKFSRGQAANAIHPDGSGLGLYICKKIIESNGGEITCESRGLGKGSTFSFTVPIYQGQEKHELASDLERIKNKIIFFDKR